MTMSDYADQQVSGFRPDDDPVFRMAQLLLLLCELSDDGSRLDRLTYYDFFAENPFLVVQEEGVDRARLRLAGFESAALSYYSPAQRFVTRQERVGADLSLLTAYGLATCEYTAQGVIYRVTELGAQTATSLSSMHANAYRLSSSVILSRLRSFNDKQLHLRARDWLKPERLGLAELRPCASERDGGAGNENRS